MKTIKELLSGERHRRKPLRWWPGVIIVLIQWLARFGLPAVMPVDEAVMIGVFSGLIGGFAVVLWWAFFSRTPWAERFGALALMAIALVATSKILDRSIAEANMGLMFTIYSIPVMSMAFVVWAVACRNLADIPRRVTMVVTILLASGGWALLRTNGMTSDLHHDFAWRWSETGEEKFLAGTGHEAMAQADSNGTGAVWPGFRGPGRNGVVHGARIETDWKTTPPAELWRREVGPGCSSIAIVNGLIFTQEQRGDMEAVTCYNLTTGKPVWIHSDKARFWDSHAGAGPRATPAFSNGRIYTLGATGILNALNAGDGKVIWSRNAASDTRTKDSGWGFTGSPLVVDDLVIVAATGKLAAYEITTGQPRWFGPNAGAGYSSPQLITIDGVKQVVLMSDTGLTSLAPADGKLLWKYIWPMDGRILQPALTEDGDILVNGGFQDGTRRITVVHGQGGWNIKVRWTSTGLRPSFNDLVVDRGHAYGFNGRSLACIDISDGKLNWNHGRYGGQVILLADQRLILVLTEKGELALVAATPERFTELARIPAIRGKTWNHPVMAGDILVVRNSEEMVAYRLTAAKKIISAR